MNGVFTMDKQELVSAIENWDKEDVADLLDMLTELDELDAEDPYNIVYVDMSDLPSEPFPIDIDTSYPVWAMDVKGYCLVGASADTIEHIDKIREWQRDQT